MQRILAVATLALLCAGCSTSPTVIPDRDKPAAGAEAATALRVMSFNVQSCKKGLDPIADVIRRADPDVVALQEIDVGTRRSAGLDQVAELAARSGYPYHRFVEATQMKGGRYGIALLSRFPIESLEHHPLPVRGLEPRVIAHAVIRAGDREVSIYPTHLSAMPMNSSIRGEQARLIERMMRQDPRPKLVIGDMNDIPSSEAVQTLTTNLVDTFGKAGKGPAGTFPLPLSIGAFRYDYVLASSDWAVERSFVIQAQVSDHYPVVSDLVLPGGAKPMLVDGSVRPAAAEATR